MLRIEKPGRILNCTEHPYTQQESEFRSSRRTYKKMTDTVTFLHTSIQI